MNTGRIRQRPARELMAMGITIPYFHPAEHDHLPVNYHLTLLLLPLPLIDRLAIAARKETVIKRPNPNDNRPEDGLDYPPSNKERHAFIRHLLFNRTARNLGQGRGYQNGYDNIIYKIEKAGIDVEARQIAFKRHAYALIAENYPTLATEGEDALWRWQNKLTRSNTR